MKIKVIGPCSLADLENKTNSWLDANEADKSIKSITITVSDPYVFVDNYGNKTVNTRGFSTIVFDDR